MELKNHFFWNFKDEPILPAYEKWQWEKDFWDSGFPLFFVGVINVNLSAGQA